MASNQIPQSADALVTLATDAADGATTEGASIGLSQNTAAKIRADLVNFAGDPAAVPPVIGAQNLHNAAKSAKVAASAVRRTSESNARKFCASTVGLLKNYLGTQWNAQWQAAGFTAGSLAIPDDPMSLLGEIRGYLASQPAHENAPLGITVAAGTLRIADLTATRAASNQSNLDLGTAKTHRDSALGTLYKRMTGLRTELDHSSPTTTRAGMPWASTAPPTAGNPDPSSTSSSPPAAPVWSSPTGTTPAAPPATASSNKSRAPIPHRWKSPPPSPTANTPSPASPPAPPSKSRSPR
jgi:hypothetical protein